MKTSYDIVKTLIRTEKGTDLEPQGKYFFRVASQANKIEIKSAVEEIYKVKVSTVNTLKMPAKIKRVRQEEGWTTPWKKAIVTLEKGQKIEAS